MQRDAVAQAYLDAHWFLQRYAVKSREDIEPEKWCHDLGIENYQRRVSAFVPRPPRAG